MTTAGTAEKLDRRRLANAVWRARNIETTRAWRKNNRPTINANARARYRKLVGTEELWKHSVLTHMRSRARKGNFPCTITAADLVIPAICPIYKVPLVLGLGSHHPNCPSVDRFDNSLGYVPGNVRVISLRANLLKKDATLAEIRSLLAYMESA